MDTSRPLKDRYMALEQESQMIGAKMAHLKVLHNLGYRYLDENDDPVEPDGVTNIHSGQV
jgi:hypothetical protein